jgi:hypothetical protein
VLTKCDRFRSSRFIPQAHEEVAGTFAIRAFFIAVISGCLTVCTFDPISCDSNCVNAAAALFAAGFATTSVCDPYVVTSAATLCTTRNRQFSLHLLMIRPCRCVHLFHIGRRAYEAGRMRAKPCLPRMKSTAICESRPFQEPPNPISVFQWRR